MWGVLAGVGARCGVKAYYVRWPWGDETIAVARDKADLWSLLDEQADGEKPDVLVKEIRGARFAVDLRGNDYPAWAEYESTWDMVSGLRETPHDKLTPGDQFFAGCWDKVYG